MLDPRSEKHFKLFAKTLVGAIARRDDGNKDLTARQKKQVEGLVALEIKFRDHLNKLSCSGEVYQDFINHITLERRNILSARPFFRERQDAFTRSVAGALKAGDIEELSKHHFNYQFVAFVLKRREWSPKSRLVKYGREIEEARRELVELNMPLAISRARIFWGRTQRSHLDYMDLVQIASEGLLSAIDKFVLPYTPVFRSVAIGRMTGNFIEQYSNTMLHFYPTDKRKLYRANKFASRSSDGGGLDYGRLTEAVNEGVESNHQTTPNEIAGLMAANSCLSVDAQRPGGEDEEGQGIMDRVSSDIDQQPDALAEMADAARSMWDAFACLALREVKLLRMKGVSFDPRTWGLA